MEVVNRPLQHNGIIRDRGELLETEAMRNTVKLREQRYLSPFTGEHLECSVCGRKFADEASFKAHAKKEHPEYKNWKMALRKGGEKVE